MQDLLLHLAQLDAPVQTVEDFERWQNEALYAKALQLHQAPLPKLTQIRVISGRSMRAPRLVYSQALEVRTSVLHGRGVFTRQDIPANVVVTRYPADGIMLDSVLMCSPALLQQQPQQAQSEEELLQRLGDYKMEMGVRAENNSALFIIGNQHDCDAQTLLGHMLNDGCNSTLMTEMAETSAEALEQYDVVERLVLQYYENAKVSCNCEFVRQGTAIVVRTLRAVAQDEELTVSYTLPFWMARFHTAQWCESRLLQQHIMVAQLKHGLHVFM
jgi:hypothetical protein